MRGKVGSNLQRGKFCRITPAYAGKSREGLVFLGVGVGSPPRMRGKVREEAQPGADHGITPAYAGKSPFLHQTPD